MADMSLHPFVAFAEKARDWLFDGTDGDLPLGPSVENVIKENDYEGLDPSDTRYNELYAQAKIDEANAVAAATALKITQQNQTKIVWFLVGGGALLWLLSKKR